MRRYYATAGIDPGKAHPHAFEITYGDMVERARLRVDLIKWLVSKMAPKRYGTHRLEPTTRPPTPRPMQDEL
jgi:hypothetical protein